MILVSISADSGKISIVVIVIIHAVIEGVEYFIRGAVLVVECIKLVLILPAQSHS